MPIIKTVNDNGPVRLPSVEELMASAKKGARGKGTNDPNCKLNEDIGMAVDITE